MKFSTTAMRRLALILAALLAAPAAFAQLTAVGNQFWTEESPGIPGASEIGDRMGDSVVSGDFNNDGFADLAIGLPRDTVDFVDAMQAPRRARGGSVLVLYGSANGLASANADRWQRTMPVENELFGWAMAAGDFNNDGFADLAISALSSGPASGGQVTILPGSAAGLTATGAQNWNQDSPNILGASEAGDSFGSALAADDFNADGFADLAIGVQGEGTGEFTSAGAVAVLYGGASGLSAAGNQFFTSSQPQNNSFFGESLATGDFNNDGAAELVVGEAREPFVAMPNPAAVYFLAGSNPNGLTPPQRLPTDTLGTLFGFSLAVGDFDNNGFDDVAIGAPKREYGTQNQGPSRFGKVTILLGSNLGIGAIEPKTFGVESSGPGEFSRALIAADFNNDGFDDLAGSVPLDNQSTAEDAVRSSGSVAVFGGNARGDLEFTSEFQVWIQGAGGMRDRAETNDRLGGRNDNEFHQQTLAAGDFNGDGLADLAIGVPLENLEDPDVGAIQDTGGVHILYGTRENPEQRNDWLQQLNAIRDPIVCGAHYYAESAASDIGSPPKTGGLRST